MLLQQRWRLNLLLTLVSQEKKLAWSYTTMQATVFLAASGVKFYQFQAKESEFKSYPLQLGNISEDLGLVNLTKIALKGNMHDFTDDYTTIDTGDIAYIHKCLMEKYNIV